MNRREILKIGALLPLFAAPQKPGGWKFEPKEAKKQVSKAACTLRCPKCGLGEIRFHELTIFPDERKDLMNGVEVVSGSITCQCGCPMWMKGKMSSGLIVEIQPKA